MIVTRESAREWHGEPSGEIHEPAGCGVLEGFPCAEAPNQAEAERTVQVVLLGQSMSTPKPAADYLAELRREVSELRLSPLDLEVTESFSLGGEAEIIEEMSQEGEEEEDLLEFMELDSEAVVLLDALGVLGGAGRGEEACVELEAAKQEHVRTMEPRRLCWVRRWVVAMWLAQKAGWFYPPRCNALG
ncbi:unnamed protein product [Prorocentrum cordatum]|uniref:Uncharacterized protein n=1 Tax=Prorocentrum cordatum TaxID=2364126 RepID=A0ABN9SPA6_9DINO|nr:unnamed protein product [Polarella glacialis]